MPLISFKCPAITPESDVHRRSVDPLAALYFNLVRVAGSGKQDARMRPSSDWKTREGRVGYVGGSPSYVWGLLLDETRRDLLTSVPKDLDPQKYVCIPT